LQNQIKVLAGLNYTNCTLIVPDGTVADYRANTYWGQFVNIIEKSTAAAYINVETTLSVAAAGETKTVTVDASVTWTVDVTEGNEDGEWLTATKVNETSFTVTATPNTDEIERTGEITVAGGSVTETITVTQAVAVAADPYINVETTLSVVAAGETKTVTVDANVDWEVSTTDSWITATKVDETSFTVTASANTAGVRTGEITVAGGSVTETITVTQAAAAAADPYINVEITLSVAAAGETKPVTVDANVEWTVGVTDGDGWLTATKVDETSFTVTASANTGGVRTGEITVAGGSVTETITVTQAAAAVTPPPTPPTPPAPSVVYPTGVSLDLSSVTMKTGDTQKLVATVRPQNADNKNVTWTSSDAKVATVAGGVVTAIAPGTATITVTTAVGGYRATCEVTVEEVTTGIAKATEGVAIRAEAGKLYINSPAAETVYIYSFTGKLLYTATKASGLAIFNAPSEKLLIVRGTSGWTRKLIN
jgi:hypothetical protein